LAREGKLAGGLHAPLVEAPVVQGERESFSSIPMGVAIDHDVQEGKSAVADIGGINFTADFGSHVGGQQQMQSAGYQALSEGPAPALYPSVPGVAPPPVHQLQPMSGSADEKERAALRNVQAATGFVAAQGLPVATGVPIAQGMPVAHGMSMAAAGPTVVNMKPGGSVLERKGFRAVEGQAGTNIEQAQIFRERPGGNGYGVRHVSAAPHRAGAGPKGMPIEKFGFSMPARHGGNGVNNSVAMGHVIAGSGRVTGQTMGAAAAASSKDYGKTLPTTQGPKAAILLSRIADAHRKGLVTDQFRGTLKDLVIAGKFQVAEDLLAKKERNETFWGRVGNMFA